MTPRLKILSVGLALSMIYAIYDYIERNNEESKPAYTQKRKKKRARTAGASKLSTKRLAMIEKRKKKLGISDEKGNSKDYDQISIDIPDDVSNLEGWSRNPFVAVYEPLALANKSMNSDRQKIVEEEESGLITLDGLIIETAVRMGEKAFVTINGQIFTEGDKINNALIEKIDNEQITFKIGKTRIIKDIGT